MSTSIKLMESVLSNQDQPEKTRDGWCIFAILTILFLRFFQTIILAKPISKLFLVSIWDSLFYPNRVGHSLPVDYALVLLLLPYRFFVADYWHHGIPLWNQFNGFGMPLLADPQALVFSPMFAFFYLFPSIYTWNITLIAELAVGAVSTYLLCREFKFDFVAGIVAALLFAFSPWVQWQLEPLGAGICLTPFVFLFFVRAAKNKSIWHTMLAGVAAAVDVLSSHPEVCFVTIIFACLLLGLISYFQEKTQFNLVSVLFRIGIAGIVALGLSAPMLFPFVEYLHNGETYKFDRPAPNDISWQALLANYLYPFFSVSSPYFGPLSWFGVIVALCFPKKNNQFILALFSCFAISVFSIAKLYPLNLLLLVPPLSAVQPMYCLPEYLVFLAMVSGLGISGLSAGLRSNTKIGLISALVLALVFLLAPLLYLPWHQNNPLLRFDQILQISHFHTKIWLLNVFCFFAMLLIWRILLGRDSKLRTIGCAAFIGLGVLNLAVVSYFSLPKTPSFQYPSKLPLEIAMQNGARFISLGDHLFRPNTNLAYRLPTVRVHNPLFPKGYLPFMKACGAGFDDFNQYFPATVSRLLDITGTRTLVSEQPLLDEAATIHSNSLGTSANSSIRQINYADSMVLSSIKLSIDHKTRAIYCSLIATPNANKTVNYHLDCAVEDPTGAPVCFIEPQPISGVAGSQPITFSGYVPVLSKHWILSLKLTSDSDSSQLVPTAAGTSFGHSGSGSRWIVASAEQPDLFDSIDSQRFKPISRYGGSIVAYDNKSALNRYFFVQRVDWAKDRTAALDALKKHSNEAGNVVILEDFQKKNFEEAIANSNSSNSKNIPTLFDQQGSVTNLDAKKGAPDVGSSAVLNLQVACPNISLLVVSDLYYPGWRVLLDGRDWPMFRADSLFRAMPVPAGHHRIRFEYQPVSFIIGLLAFGVTSLTLVFFWLKRRRLPKGNNLWIPAVDASNNSASPLPNRSFFIERK